MKQPLCHPSPPFALLHRINHAVAAISCSLDHLQPEPAVKDGQKTEVGFYQLSATNPPSIPLPSLLLHLFSVCLSLRKRVHEMGQLDKGSDFSDCVGLRDDLGKRQQGRSDSGSDSYSDGTRLVKC